MKQITTKVITKLMLPVMACAVMLYSSCRKSDMTPPATNAGQTTTSTTPPSNQTLAQMVATNLSHSLHGTYGGTNTLGSFSNNSALCGLITNTNVDTSAMQGDTSSHMGGYETFAFNCTSGTPSGFTAIDSLATTRQTPDGWYQWYYIKQNYTIKCLDAQHQFVGVNGTNHYYQFMKLHAYNPADTKLYDDEQDCNFVLTDLKIDVINKDILSGTAQFTANSYTWHITGTLTFIGNHLANVTIGNQTFQINTQDYSW